LLQIKGIVVVLFFLFLLIFLVIFLANLPIQKMLFNHFSHHFFLIFVAMICCNFLWFLLK
jgi:hypothetical protein